MTSIHKQVIQYLTEKYDPQVIITYGSFADGTQGEHSDFDALVIASNASGHDSSVISGTELDVFLYSPEHFEKENWDAFDFIQLEHSRIVLDKTGLGKSITQRVREHIASQPVKTEKEMREELVWCRKMLSRASREDDEGMFRAHWLIYESLEICFDARKQFYPGPKKGLRILMESDPEGSRVFSKALRTGSTEDLAVWIDHIESLAFQ